MTKITKATTSNPAAPVKAPTVAPAVAKAKKPSKQFVAAQSVKSVAKKKPLTPPAHASTRGKPKPEVSPDQRRCYVEVAAYFIAERHGFTLGREHDDWVAAEAEIDRMIADGKLRVDQGTKSE